MGTACRINNFVTVILRLKKYLVLVMVDVVDFNKTFEYHCDIFGSVGNIKV